MASLLTLMNEGSLRFDQKSRVPSLHLEIESVREAENKESAIRISDDQSTRNGVYITWEDLWVTIPNGRSVTKPLLQGLTGYARPGELLAVMGPSGCGKTTLLDALAGKGLSGGQKRRVSICLEMLTHPKLLFLDEPTSGLDSAASYYVMKRIAKLNHMKDGVRRTIIASIHQPSSEVFQLFDSLCLLSNGKAVYFGPTSTSNEFFASAGFPCPILQNPSDHFLKTINKDFAMDAEEGQEVSVDEAIRTLTSSYKSSKYCLEAVQEVANIRKQGVEDLGLLKAQKRSKASFLTQCCVLTRRSSVNMSRDKGYYWFRLFINLAIAMSMGYIYYDLGYAYDSIQARGSLIMFITTFLNFMVVGGFPSFVEDMKVFIRERLNGHYSTGAFIVANAISSVPYLFLLTVATGAILYYLPGFHQGIRHFSYFLLLLFASMMAIEGLMMVIASIVPNFLIGVIVGSGVQGFMILGGGIFRLPKDMPKPLWKYPVYYLSLHRYGYQGFLINEFEGLKFHGQYSDNQQAVISGEQALRDDFQISSGSSKWANLWILLAMVMLYRVLFFAIIKFNEVVKPKVVALMALKPNQATQVMESPA